MPIVVVERQFKPESLRVNLSFRELTVDLGDGPIPRFLLQPHDRQGVANVVVVAAHAQFEIGQVEIVEGLDFIDSFDQMES